MPFGRSIQKLLEANFLDPAEVKVMIQSGFVEDVLDGKAGVCGVCLFGCLVLVYGRPGSKIYHLASEIVKLLQYC